MSDRVEEEPTLIGESATGEESYTHPAFGLISASRVSGDYGHLFGSKLKHTQTVQITLTGAELHRSLHRDWHFARQTKFVVALSEAQWARFISSMNVGSGSPCTVQYQPANLLPLEVVPSIKAESPNKQAKDEIEACAKKVVEKANALLVTMRSFEDKPPTKKQYSELVAKMAHFVSSVPGNATFLQAGLLESMEHIVSDGKTELEAFATHAVIQAGLSAMGQPSQQLIAAPVEFPSE